MGWSWTPDVGKYYFIQSKLNGMVLAVLRGSAKRGAPIVQQHCTGGPNQQFRFEPAGDGTYFICNRKSGMAISVWQGSTEDGAPVVQSAKQGRPNQRFYLDDAGGGALSLRNMKSGLVLDIPESADEVNKMLVQNAYVGRDSQRLSPHFEFPTNLRIIDVTCHQPSAGIEFQTNDIVGVVATVAGAGAGIGGAGMAVAGVMTGGTAVAVVGAAIGVAGLGTVIAGLVDEGIPDDLYLEVDGRQVWPSEAYKNIPANVPTRLDLSFRDWNWDRTFQLFDYDTISNDDPVTPEIRINPMRAFWDTDFTILTGLTDEGSVYSITVRLD